MLSMVLLLFSNKRMNCAQAGLLVVNAKVYLQSIMLPTKRSYIFSNLSELFHDYWLFVAQWSLLEYLFVCYVLADK